ncbi:MAG: hypothetical protein QW462_05520 [Candidatus Nezhaarchaeales archaeon]
MIEVEFTRSFDVICKFDVLEEPDWDYARNKHVLLKDVLLEYSTSSFNAPISTTLGILHGGNRDFSWQGLLVGPINGTVYKVLDAIYYKPLDAQELKPVYVAAGRNKALYSYIDEQGKAYDVRISIRTLKDRGRLEVFASRPSVFAPIFAFYDMRTNYESPFQIVREGNAVKVEPETIPLRLIIRGFSTLHSLNQEFYWVYKLGDGFRTVSEGKVYFVRHVRRVKVPIALTSEEGLLSVEIPLRELSFKRIDYRVRDRLRRLRGELKKKVRYEVTPQVIDALVLRIDRLMAFGIPIDSILAPEAGAMWFKSVWTRDLLEGLRWNLLTYTRILGVSSWLIKLVEKLISIAYENRGLRVFLNEGDHVSDAFPQLINLAVKLYTLTHDKALIKKTLKLTSTACKLLRSGESFSACKLYDGLLLCKANTSWTDVIYEIDGEKWPLRIPLDWMNKTSPGSTFALVEVNALFIESLNSLLKVVEGTGLKVDSEIYEVKFELLDGYKKWFYVEDGLPPSTIEPLSNLRDWTPSSTGLVALAVLKNIVYDKSNISKAWKHVKAMIVKRKLVKLGDGWEDFGIITRKVEERPYLGDLEYHGPVVWPRDTPYLMEIMKELGMDLYGILINNLDHMISEGAIGYANELFSLPVGTNPHPSGELSLNPVPVKNYAQYWSHWCDPYIEYFLEGDSL